MEPVGADTDEGVPGPRRRPVEQPIALHHADAETREVELVGLHQARVLGRLSADQRTAGQRAAVGDRGHQGRHSLGKDPTHGHVVQEEERFGPGADQIVGAHRHQVVANRVVPAQCHRDPGLRSHSVR
jgi:hypothetical protein